jgi:putative two-component system response regulator
LPQNWFFDFRKVPIRCLILSHTAQIRDSFRQLFLDQKWELVECVKILTAAEHLDQAPFDVVAIEFSDHEDLGLELIAQVQKKASGDKTPILGLTQKSSLESQSKLMRLGCHDLLVYPWTKELFFSRVGTLVQNLRFFSEMNLTEEILGSIARIIGSRFDNSRAYEEKLGRLNEKFAHFLGLRSADMRTLAKVVQFHNIGNIVLPDRILLKPDKLSEGEMKAVRRHPVIGEKICRTLHSLRDIAPIVRSHHERWDGSGYPDGIAKNGIPYLARLFQVVDCYAAMTTDRPHRKSLTDEEARKILFKEAKQKYWDPVLVEKFLAFLNEANSETTGDLP